MGSVILFRVTINVTWTQLYIDRELTASCQEISLCPHFVGRNREKEGGGINQWLL